MKLNRRAQSTLEYAALVIAVGAACVAMYTYLSRAINANLRTIEEQVNAEPD